MVLKFVGTQVRPLLAYYNLGVSYLDTKFQKMLYTYYWTTTKSNPKLCLKIPLGILQLGSKFSFFFAVYTPPKTRKIEQISDIHIGISG
jgi:hypothetical protein